LGGCRRCAAKNEHDEPNGPTNNTHDIPRIGRVDITPGRPALSFYPAMDVYQRVEKTDSVIPVPWGALLPSVDMRCTRGSGASGQ
jgi:hypothetical protein